MPSSLASLLSQWRNEADTLRKCGAVEQAVVSELRAEELETALREWDEALLNLTEASHLSGYSSEHLGRMVRNGTIPNAGRPNAPRIRRGDLPRKAGLPPGDEPMQIADTSRSQIARSIVQGGEAR